jgi:radical SAM-linked protein
MDRYYPRRIAMALPSLRVETLTPQLIEDVKRVRKTSFTLAPEAGTQRLRDAINKGNTEEDLLETTSRVFAAGWRTVKLYFMIGLPGETDEDIEGIAGLAYRVLRTAKNRGEVKVSLSTFVPKAHTPFQWERQISIEEAVEKQNYLKNRLKSRNLSVKWHDAGMSFLEGIFSRGGAETGALIEAAYNLGCRFDGWGDKFRFALWEEAFKKTGIDAASYLRKRSADEEFPWDMIASGLDKSFLLSEAQKAKTGAATPDCRTGPCSNCGVCDHKKIKVITVPRDAAVGAFVSTFSDRSTVGKDEKNYRIRFTKIGPAKFLSHLELSSALRRAMTIGGIFFVYSQGFHPHPHISFAGATSVGMESLCELADIRIYDPLTEPRRLIGRINAGLPEGMEVTEIMELLPVDVSLAELVTGFSFDIIPPEKTTDAENERLETAIRRFLAEDHFDVKRVSDKKEKIKDIRPFVAGITLDRPSGVIRLSANSGPQGTIRPSELLTSVLGFTADEALRFRIIKTAVRSAEPFK